MKKDKKMIKSVEDNLISTFLPTFLIALKTHYVNNKNFVGKNPLNVINEAAFDFLKKREDAIRQEAVINDISAKDYGFYYAMVYNRPLKTLLFYIMMKIYTNPYNYSICKEEYYFEIVKNETLYTAEIIATFITFFQEKFKPWVSDLTYIWLNTMKKMIKDDDKKNFWEEVTRIVKHKIR